MSQNLRDESPKREKKNLEQKISFATEDSFQGHSERKIQTVNSIFSSFIKYNSPTKKVKTRTIRSNYIINRAIIVGKDVEKVELEEDDTSIYVERRKNNIVVLTQEKTYNHRVSNFVLRIIGKHNLNIIELFGQADPLKEISEVGAIIYYSKMLSKKFRGKVCCYVIGEGKRPCISRLLHLEFPELHIVSIDPLINISDKDINNVNNVEYHSKYDTEVDTSNYVNYDTIFILGLHSHNNMTDFWNRFIYKNKFLINIPCCVQPTLEHEHQCITEHGISSIMKKIYIDSDIRE